MASVKTKISISINGAMDDQTIRVSSSLIKKYKIPQGTSLLFKVGSIQETVRVLSTGNAGVQIHANLAERTGLSDENTLCLKYNLNQRTLSVGPIVGVMLRKISSNMLRPFGNVTSFARELTEAARLSGGLVYFFSADQLEERGGRIAGLIYNKGWKKGMFPYPDALYNRLTSRVVEKSTKVQRFISEAKTQYHSVVFNERYLDKAEVFSALKKEADVAEVLPESYTYQGSKMLRAMLNRHAAVFLKPVLSSLGKGIIRVRRGGSGGYESHIAGNDGKIRQMNFASFPSMLKSLGPRLKKAKYIIQEGIDLLTSSGSPIDFRALVQRNGKGEWKLTSIVARIAASRTFVSNLARGGKLTTVDGAFSAGNLPVHLRSATSSRLKKVAVDIAKGIETQISDAHFAELGIDLAVDYHGRVYLLEVNSKPSKEDNSPLVLEDSTDQNPTDGGKSAVRIRPSVRRVVCYSKYLGGF
ncbi:YheC/YheD family protein [Gorillibacterium massiliense]|uniref:YheC/YheD family endospore coat-associated protein n=1 Tax=Gorillibacterium massiliense TaxID=1280390 RepID=UPI0004AE7A8A|nr:YheC/YheD family protein [Gorillibacterium massiliense]